MSSSDRFMRSPGQLSVARHSVARLSVARLSVAWPGQTEGDRRAPHQPARPFVPAIGLDIGGAHLKSADSEGRAAAIPFALWRTPDRLATAIAELLGRHDGASRVGVTMTGELADCFRDRSEGVRHIVAACQAAVEGRAVELGFYSVDGCFLGADAALRQVDAVAAANWHALALYLSHQVDRPTLLIDVGSTTTDLIPLRPGEVATASRTDFDRLRQGELVYAGIGRTPVCALVRSLPFRGQWVPIMNEVFATSDDAALLLGWLPEAPQDRQTADGRGRSRADAANRMARMIGLDHRQVMIEDAVPMARCVMQRISRRIEAAARRAAPDAAARLLCGHGTALVRTPPGIAAASLPQQWGQGEGGAGEALSRVAPAYAVASLAAGAGHVPIVVSSPG